MSIMFNIRQLLLVGGVLCSAGMAANDTVTVSRKDYDYIRRSDPRLTASNAAGLRYLPVDKIAEAHVFAKKSNGPFVNYHESDDSYAFGAVTQSFYRLSPKVVLYGRVSYDNFTGRNMGGSVFMNPYEQPFDIVEYADTTGGTKNLESYRLTGAMGADLTERLTMAGKIDYRTANYAKQKDLRHKNKLMDLTFVGGLTYRLAETLEIGAAYHYRRSIEGLEFDTYGTTDKEYYSLISYGAFFGMVEPFGGTGYTHKDSNNPMYNKYHGLSLQLSCGRPENVHFFSELLAMKRVGEYGQRASGKILYSEHNSRIFAYDGGLSLRKGADCHRINIRIENEMLENFENVYKFDTKPNGTTVVEYYDPLKTADKERLALKAVYTADIGVQHDMPLWTFRAGVDWYRNKQTVSFYPYYRKQTIRYTDCSMGVTRHILKGRNEYALLVDLRYSFGGGAMNKDGEYVTPGENQTKPKYNNKNLYNEFEYFTNARIKGNIGLRYSRVLDKKSAIKGFVDFTYSLTKAFDVKYIDGDRFNVFTLAVGCVF